MKDQIAEKFSSELKSLGIRHTLLEHPQLVSVESVQKYLGYGLADAGATLVMKADNEFVGIIRRGDTKLDSGKVKKLLGASSLRMATEEEFTRLTGVPSGAASVYVPGLPMYIDNKIFEKEFINAGSGSLLITIRYKTADLKKIPGIKIVDVTIPEDVPASGSVGPKVVAVGKRLVSGITPSGDGTLHIGNYLGAVKQFIELAKTNDCFLFVADMHALTTIQDKATLQKNTETLILNELSLLGDLKNITFYRQSDIGLHPELQSILNNVTPLGLLKRAHAYKDKLAKDVMEDEINLGLFNYPILMAADILLYKPELVPVGKDQKQHVEITRDIAERFNKTFKKNVFVLPDAYIPEEVAVVLGTDGQRKMSKSLGNLISIFEDDEVIRKQVNGTFTDPTRKHVTDRGHIEGNMVFVYLDHFGEKGQVDELKKRYREGKVGDVEVKNYLFESLTKTFAPARKRYQELKENPGKVKEILEKGADRARSVATKTMQEVREAIGLTNQYSFFQYPSAKSQAGAAEGKSKTISISEFAAVEMRVGKVIEAANYEKSEKLIRLVVDVGPEIGQRVVFTGVRPFGYTPEDFLGKQFFIIVNLEPRKMLDEYSQGMILAVDGPGKPIFLTAEGMPIGAKIR